MDNLALDQPVLYQTLRELDFINETLGGNAISINAFNRLTKKERDITVMDMGTGSGKLLRKMSIHSRQAGIKFRGIGIDANPYIANYAREHTSPSYSIQYADHDVLDTACYQEEIDIIHACLFTHHFSDEQLIWLFKKWKETAKKAVIINDLYRNTIAYYSIKWLTQFFCKSSMVKYDAPLSVARGFKRKELEEILTKAGIEDYQLKWKWAFRWLLVF